MPAALEITAALAVGAAVTWLATPRVRGLALRTDFLDHPVGYKRHRQATPYLGGIAVMIGFGAAAIPFGHAFSDFTPIVLCALGLLVVGTIDDRIGLGIGIRLIAQLIAAVLIWDWGAGWGLGNEGIDLLLTILWVVGVTNAFNLMDNLDGAAGTVGAVSSAGIAFVAIVNGDPVLGAFAFALSGACMGFLPHNLAKPSRIFLGDGGSMSVGFLVASMALCCPHQSLGWVAVLAAAPLVGLPIFDTALVVISRFRRGVMVLSGGRDHITHRLLTTVGSERSVCAVLAASQALLCLLALGLHELGHNWIVAIAAVYMGAGAVFLVLVDEISTPHVAGERAT